jgi:hypothetical protein
VPEWVAEPWSLLDESAILIAMPHFTGFIRFICFVF